MARKIELKVSCLSFNGRDGMPVVISWAEQMQSILRGGPQGQVADQVLRSVEAMGPIGKAIEQKADCVTLTEEQYRTLRERLDVFQFPFADPVFGELILEIRNAQEIGTN